MLVVMRIQNLIVNAPPFGLLVSMVGVQGEELLNRVGDK
jgi:hypothetical protein